MTTNADKHAELAQALREQFRFDPFIGPIRDPNLPHDPPNPRPLSVVQVGKNADYQCVCSRDAAQGLIEYVVLHKATQTYWRAYYTIGLDSSDADRAAGWLQVSPRVVEIIVYDSVK